MDSSKRDYFGNSKDTNSYQEHYLDFMKTMLSFAIVTNIQSPECKKASKKTHHLNKKK